MTDDEIKRKITASQVEFSGGGRAPEVIERLDHVALAVTDISRSASFYSAVLGMRTERFGQGRVAVRFGEQKLNLNPVRPGARPGQLDFCLIAGESPGGVGERLAEHGVAIALGPVGRIGALGPMQSLYIHDPDGNVVEIGSYPHGAPAR